MLLKFAARQLHILPFARAQFKNNTQRIKIDRLGNVFIGRQGVSLKLVFFVLRWFLWDVSFELEASMNSELGKWAWINDADAKLITSRVWNYYHEKLIKCKM